MVLAKSKNAVGLGNSLMNDRFGKGKGADRKKTTATGIQRTHKDTGETYVTNEKQEASWVKMRSVTEQAALDEFLSTAELAGTDFTAEKMNNVKIIHTDQKNPYLLSAAEERAAVGKQKADMLTLEQRQYWADYFEAAGIKYKFFSAALAKELNEAMLEETEEETEASASASKLAEKARALGLDDDDEDDEDSEADSDEQDEKAAAEEDDEESDEEITETESTRILTVDELEALFLVHAPDVQEALYGMKIVTRPLEEGGTGIPTAEEMLTAYARARGFRRTGQGQPDESRAARHILKDYVNGKLLFCQPPPLDIDPFEFNRELYDEGHLPEKRRQALASMASSADDQASVADSDVIEMPQGPKSKNLDSTFFAQGQGNSAHLRMPFSHKYSEQGTASGKLLSGRKQATLIALEKDVDPNDIKKLTSKKHFKGNKPGGKGKRRANYFAD
ncbi:ribosome biogenesis GTPase [Botrytis cinerea]